MTSHLLLVGFTVGLLTIVPPGPVTLTLIEVGAAQGRQQGARGALGIAAGDLVAALGAATLVLGGGALPAVLFDGLQLVSSLMLLAFGGALLLRPAALHTLAVGIDHPARAFFLITILTPTVLGAWVAIIAAMPFADDGGSVLQFVAGAMVASLVWHLLLGSAAGDLGRRIDERGLRLVSRAGGLTLAGFGLVTLVA